VCDLAFNQRGHVDRHIARVHTWGYVCSDCGQTDFKQTDFKLHFVLHYHDFNWFCLFCYSFSTLRLLVGWKEGHWACKQLRGGVVLASVKSRLVLPFWYWLTRVVPEKGPLNGCVSIRQWQWLGQRGPTAGHSAKLSWNKVLNYCCVVSYYWCCTVMSTGNLFIFVTYMSCVNNAQWRLSVLQFFRWHVTLTWILHWWTWLASGDTGLNFSWWATG